MDLVSLRGPLLLTSLCATPLVLWALASPLEPRFTGELATLTSLAELAAYAGTSAFALNLVLGARLRTVERLFGGLERMYDAHRVNGQVAFALLLGHVVLILASRATISADAALDLLSPSAGWTVFAGVLAFAGLTLGIVLTLFVRMGHELFVWVQRSFGAVFLVASYHVFTTPGAQDESEALELYIAALATAGIAGWAYRSVLGNVLVRRRRYRVVRVNRLNDLVTEIAMQPLEEPLAFTPGQFVFVNFRSPTMDERFNRLVRNQFHPFSITSAPDEPVLRITVKAVGDYTRAMRSLEPGAEVVVEGPYGSFSHRNVPNERQVWLAGGIGVTPFLSMARSLGERNGLAVDLYFCVEHEEEAHFLDELRAIDAGRDDFGVVLVPRDRDGFLTAERLAREQGDLREADVLICGPPAMIDTLRAQLREAGVDPERVHAEEFGFAKIGRAPADEQKEPGVLAADPKLLASLAGVAFAGPALAIVVVLSSYLMGGR